MVPEIESSGFLTGSPEPILPLSWLCSIPAPALSESGAGEVLRSCDARRTAPGTSSTENASSSTDVTGHMYRERLTTTEADRREPSEHKRSHPLEPSGPRERTGGSHLVDSARGCGRRSADPQAQPGCCCHGGGDRDPAHCLPLPPTSAKLRRLRR